MNKIKGTDIVSIRKLFSERGKDDERAFIATLSPELWNLYQTALYATWSSVELQILLYEKAAHYLFPNDQKKMYKLGRAMAEKSYGGVYKFFLKIPSVSMILNISAKVWNTYFDTGKGKIETISKNTIYFVVQDFPGLPAAMGDAVSGNITMLMEYAGAKNCEVMHIAGDPNYWKWLVKWK